jgi:hypothetical protein
MADPNLPNFKNSVHCSTAMAIKVVRDVSGGTPLMRDAGTAYLPKEKREPEIEYRCRLNRTVFFNAYLRTVQSLVGMVFNDPIVLEDDVPQPIQDQMEDVDLAGNNLDVFTKRHFTDQFEGWSFILVDMDTALPDGATYADEKASGRRPYWVSYKGDQAVNWRRARINGKQEFTLITFEEKSTEPDGSYGEKEVCKYRTFRKENGVVSWDLYRLNEKAIQDEDKMIWEDGGTTTLTRIPVAVSGEIGKAPALLDLAYLNISHWQNSSDQENILHVTRVPMLVRIGSNINQDPAEVEVGVKSTLDAPEGGDWKWLEVRGDGAMSVGRSHLLDIEQRMGMMGLSTLTQRADTNITATEKKQDKEEKHSELATMAQSEKDCIELALSYHAEYLGLGTEAGGSIKLGVKEENLALTPQHLTVLLSAVRSNDFSLESWLTVVLGMLRETGLLSEDVSVDDEVAKVKEAKQTAQASAIPTLAQKALKSAPASVSNLFNAQQKPAA